MQGNSKIDDKSKIANPIYDTKKFAEDSLEIHRKDSNDESYFPGESIKHQLTLKKIILRIIIIATSYLINVLPMNMLILMIQIKLHLITKLL